MQYVNWLRKIAFRDDNGQIRYRNMATKLLSGECILQDGTNRRVIRGKNPYYAISTNAKFCSLI